ncbi:hypothetical protein HOY82DRAFT_574586 [Tuber indicum]|nr:hypothetical protein HOY82DRAFT_574586 [Tuber indicum]
MKRKERKNKLALLENNPFKGLHLHTLPPSHKMPRPTTTTRWGWQENLPLSFKDHPPTYHYPFLPPSLPSFPPLLVTHTEQSLRSSE